jgi:hypothetical protein
MEAMPKDKTGSGTECVLDGGGGKKIAGARYVASTLSGIPLLVWVPGSELLPNSRYFCHGHALGTFTSFSYTVFSNCVWNVLNDEYTFLGWDHGAGTPQDLQVGDILAWYAHEGGSYVMTNELFGGDLKNLPAVDIKVPMVEHTALVTGVPKGVKKLETITVSSKNGFGPLWTGRPSALKALYGGRIAYYRRNAAPPAAITVTLFGPGNIFTPPGKDG